MDAESAHDGNTAHSFENTRTVCHHAPRATHVDRQAARAHNTTCRSPPDSSRKCLPPRMNRPVPHAGITFALCLHERSACSACGTSATVADWPHRGAMHERHASIFTPAVAAMMVWLASPALAQAPPDPSSRRADLLGDARESLTDQSVPPGRSTIERGLYWYDNQHVLAKLFGGWKGIHLAGGDFPAGAGFKVGIGYDHVDRIGRYRPRGSRTASRSRRAPPTAHADMPASVPESMRATSAARLSISARSASITSTRRKTSSASGSTASSQDAPTTCSTRSRAAAPSTGGLRSSDFGAAAGYLASARRHGTGQPLSVDRGRVQRGVGARASAHRRTS